MKRTVQARTRPSFRIAGFAATAVVLSCALWSSSFLPAHAAKPGATTHAETIIGRGSAALPPAVAEMRDAIIAAARTGNLDELLIPIQWNELPPDFGDHPTSETFSKWRKGSPDGTGREWLALLINLLESPYVVVHKGPDIENPQVFIWPAVAELPLASLSPALDVELLRLVTPADAARMKQQGRYDGYGIAIGADGTWHAFKKTVLPNKKVKQEAANN